MRKLFTIILTLGLLSVLNTIDVQPSATFEKVPTGRNTRSRLGMFSGGSVNQIIRTG